MKTKYLLIIFLALVTISIVFVTATPRWKTNPCPINSDTNIVFYGETGFGGVGTLSRSWVIHFLNWWEQQNPSINYVELDSGDIKSDCNLNDYPNIKVYIQPGGDAYKMQNKLDSAGRTAITNYINSGKGYLGVCAGFYYTANDYYWQGKYYNWPEMLDYYPATVEGSITDIADYEGNPDHKLTPLSNGFNAIYYGGPTIGWRDTQGPAPGETLATFSEISGDLPAIIKYNGNALLTSVHLEAFENDGIDGLSTTDRVENYKLLANLLNEVSGTNFNVPPYTNPPVCGNNQKEVGEVCDGTDLGGQTCQTQGFDDGTLSCLSDCLGFDTSACITLPKQCNDNIDNDGDNLTDYPADLGCDSPLDEDETDYTGPVELLSDSFEDGNLVGWSLSGTGTPWTASTDTAYEGSWSARAKKTGVSQDSFMEISIPDSCSNTLKFEYYRKLVGLDVADDFEVQYLDSSWISVEHLGSGSENNANFLFKSFTIPNTATKVRFKCECGAVSEKCYIDNVKITCE